METNKQMGTSDKAIVDYDFIMEYDKFYIYIFSKIITKNSHIFQVEQSYLFGLYWKEDASLWSNRWTFWGWISGKHLWDRKRQSQLFVFLQGLLLLLMIKQ